VILEVVVTHDSTLEPAVVDAVAAAAVGVDSLRTKKNNYNYRIIK